MIYPSLTHYPSLRSKQSLVICSITSVLPTNTVVTCKEGNLQFIELVDGGWIMTQQGNTSYCIKEEDDVVEPCYVQFKPDMESKTPLERYHHTPPHTFPFHSITSLFNTFYILTIINLRIIYLPLERLLATGYAGCMAAQLPFVPALRSGKSNSITNNGGGGGGGGESEDDKRQADDVR